jgi:6-phosphogluconolactonase
MLTNNQVSYTHTRGKTPRHFQFDPSGDFLLSANQDTDSITLFRFHKDDGHLEFTGETYGTLHV